MAHRRDGVSFSIWLCICLIVAVPLAAPVAADTTATVPDTATPTPGPPPRMLAGYTPLPLASLSPTAANLIAASNGAVTLAVALPGQGIVYTANSDTRLPLASVAKLLIMLTLLDGTMRPPRELSEDERESLNAMITVSDNDAADALWDEIGGSAGVRAFLDCVGITGVTFSPDDDWGDTAASGEAVAVLLARLETGDLLDAPRRALALDFMGRVIPDQHWGVTALALDVSPGVTVDVKNGWYPDDDGWRVTSAGIIVPKAGGQSYTIAVFTGGQSDLVSGIATIEAITRAIAAALTQDPVPGLSGNTPR